MSTAYTAEAIVSEGFRRAGRCLSPTEQARGESAILKEIRHDIWIRTTMSGTTQLRALAADSVMVLRPGQTRYTLPDDFDDVEHCHLYNGTRIITINSAGAPTSFIALQAQDVQLTDVGKKIIWLDGAAEAYLQDIVSVSVTDQNNWSVGTSHDFETGQTPTAGSRYLVVNNVDELHKVYMEELEAGVTFNTGRPFEYAIQSERLQLDRPPDKEYGIRIRYYVNITKVQDGSKIDTQINERWYSVLVKGVYWIASLQIGDTVSRDAYQQYLEAVEHLKWKEQDRGADESSLGFWKAEAR